MSASRFLQSFAATVLALVLLWTGVLAILHHLGRLRPPPFTNRWEFDEKLALLRARPPAHIDVLAVGSSTTFWGFDGGLLERELDVKMFNGAALGLKMHQTAWLVDFFRELHPEIATVLVVSTLIDFEACRPHEAQLFDVADVRAWLQGRWPEFVWYFRYFDPVGVLRAARDLPERRALGWDRLASMRLDPWGGQLLDVPRSEVPEGIVRGVLGGFDARCYEALERLAASLAAARVRLLFVLAPMRPGYLAERDPEGHHLAAHRLRLRSLLAAHRAEFLDAHAQLALPEEAFFDAYHLRAPYARRQTQLIAAALRSRSPDSERLAGAAETQPSEPVPAPGG